MELTYAVDDVYNDDAHDDIQTSLTAVTTIVVIMVMMSLIVVVAKG
jgi:hypothetical protein